MSANLTSPGLAAASRGASMPRGEEVASFATYAEAQRAVDALSDEGFPVQYLAIIGTDLRQVERITGRMSWGRAVASGAGSGLWIGIFIGVMMVMFSPSGSAGVPLAACVLMGVLWGILFQVVSYALTRGRRDFTSVSQVIASRYSIIAAQQSHEAARALAQAPGNLSRGGQAARRAEERRRVREASGPTAFGSRPDEQPRYGVRLPQGQPSPQSPAGDQPGQERPGQVRPRDEDQAQDAARWLSGQAQGAGDGTGGPGREAGGTTQGGRDDDVLAPFRRPRHHPQEEGDQDRGSPGGGGSQDVGSGSQGEG